MNEHIAARQVLATRPPGFPALGRLRTTLGDTRLEALDPVEYAQGHARFETRSDQRTRLTAWLVERLGARADAPTRVLSIGCGDGTVDVRVAAALAAQGQAVEYVGVEPHAASSRAFADRLAHVPGVRQTALTDDFKDARPTGAFDVVLAVHSLYYVADLAATVRRAHGMLAPGGELIVLLAPREPINVLVRLLAPGRPQTFSEDLAALVPDLHPDIVRINARLNLSTTGDSDVDRQLLEFTVQARLPAALEGLVREALAERAVLAPGLVLPHPVDAFVLTA